MKLVFRRVMLLLTLLALTYVSNAEASRVANRTQVFTSATPGAVISLVGTSTRYHAISWNPLGTFSACSVKLQLCADLLCTSPSDLIPGQTCTSAGSSSFTSGSANYVRIDPTTFTGGTSLSITYSGWDVIANTGPFLFTWPVTDGSSGQIIKTDGSGVLSFTSTVPAGSAITSLNSQTGATQTFTNDTNVTIASAANAHALGWSGNLSVARGGSGAGTFISHGVLTGNTTSAFSATAEGATNTVLHGNTAGAPTFSAVSLTADVSGVLPTANGGTANAFFTVSGPTTSAKTFTFPNASATVLTTNALVTGLQGGTGNGFFAISGPTTSLKTFAFPNVSATAITDNDSAVTALLSNFANAQPVGTTEEVVFTFTVPLNTLKKNGDYVKSHFYHRTEAATTQVGRVRVGSAGTIGDTATVAKSVTGGANKVLVIEADTYRVDDTHVRVTGFANIQGGGYDVNNQFVSSITVSSLVANSLFVTYNITNATAATDGYLYTADSTINRVP